MRAIRWAAVALASACSAALVLPTASAVAPGAFGAPSPVMPAPLNTSLRSATLTNGAVGVAWTDGSTLHVAIRRPGQVSFPGTSLNYTPPLSSPSIVGGPPEQPTVTILPLTATTFLVGWLECGPTCRVMSATVASGASAFPAPAVVSGAQNAFPMPPSFSALPDGSAAAAWLIPTSSGYQVVVNRRTGIAGAWQGLSSASFAGPTSFPYGVVVGLDSAGVVSVSWTNVGGLFQTVARARAGTNQWGLTVVASTVHSGMFTGSLPITAMGASAKGTVLAAVDDLLAPSNYPADSIGTAINVLTHPVGSTAWSLAVADATGDGRHAVSPRVSMAPDGSAAVRFADYSPETIPSPGAQTMVSSLLVQRRGAAAGWSSPMLLDSVAADASSLSVAYEQYDWNAVLLADGTYVTAVPVPIYNSGGAVPGAGLLVRSGWTAAPQLVATSPHVIAGFGIGAGITATGRATLLFADAADGKYKAITSALTKPMPFAGPVLPATVRKAHAAACAVGWIDATTATSYRWFRNGVAIAGAVASSYTPRAADVGKTLKCRASVANSKGTTTLYSTGRLVKA